MSKESADAFGTCPICLFMMKARESKACSHLRQAKKEMLLAVKSVIECCIERLEEQECDSDDNKAQKVEIQ